MPPVFSFPNTIMPQERFTVEVAPKRLQEVTDELTINGRVEDVIQDGAQIILVGSREAVISACREAGSKLHVPLSPTPTHDKDDATCGAADETDMDELTVG